MPRRKQTAADFPPEFMQVWELAVQKNLKIEMPTAGQARNMIQRLYVFRKRLMEEAPQIAAPFYSVDLRAHDEAGNVIVGKSTNVPGKAIIRVHQSDWKAQVAQQFQSVSEGGGITPSTAVGALSESVVTPDSPPSDQLSETLSILGFKG